MSKIISFAKTVRRNWKKSTVIFGIVSYGVSYGLDRYQTFQMMRAYCEEAKKYGERSLPHMVKPKHITVILNPEANDKKCNVQFEKFAAPLLHLAGFKVSVFQTEKEKQAGELMQVMSNTDAVIVAGGNGTLHEVVTGLLNRSDIVGPKFPLGVVPLGKTNTVARYLFGSKSSSQTQLMAEAVMAVIRETTVSLDVLKIQYADEKPLFAVSNFEQGVFVDAEQVVPKYWYMGPLKAGFAYFKHSLKNWKPIDNMSLEYIASCEGCSKCFIPPQLRDTAQNTGRWWSVFVPKTIDKTVLDSYTDYSKVVNEDCGEHLPLPLSYSNLSVSTVAADPMEKNMPGSLWIKTFPSEMTMKEFISSGLNHRERKLGDVTVLSDIRQGRELIVESSQEESEHEDEFCFIDNEKYKRAPCSISLLPRQVTVYG